MQPRPIASAPKRQPVLIHDPEYGPDFVCVAVLKDDGHWDDGVSPLAYEPTQWWPLPKPSAKALN